MNVAPARRDTGLRGPRVKEIWIPDGAAVVVTLGMCTPASRDGGGRGPWRGVGAGSPGLGDQRLWPGSCAWARDTVTRGSSRGMGGK